MNEAWPQPDGEKDDEADIAIGCFAALCRDRLADRLLRYAQAKPRSNVGVHELTLAELLPGVRAGRVQLAVAPDGVAADPGCGLQSMTLWHEQALVAMAPGHRLASVPQVTLSALLGTVVLLSTDRAEGEMQRYLLARLFAGVRPPVNARPGRGEDLLARITTGDSVALVLAGHRVPAGLITRPIAAAAAGFAVQAWWRADHGSPALATLLRLLGDEPG